MNKEGEMVRGDDIAGMQKLLALLSDNQPQDEQYHERNCPACDVAAEVVGALGACWDVTDEWFTAPAIGWPGDLTIAQQAEKIVAHVLHRRLVNKPPDK